MPFRRITSAQRLCAFLAAGQSAPLHKETNCHDDYRENYGGLNYIRKRHVLHLPGLFRQFDSVGVFLIALMLFGKNFFQPLCLPFSNPLIRPRGRMTYKEVLTANITPERPHLMEASCFLPARLLYRHCLHLRTSLGRFMAVICCYAIAEISSTRAFRFMVSILQGDCRSWRQAEDCRRQVAKAMIPEMELSQKAMIGRPIA